jgi:hypothetical protein
MVAAAADSYGGTSAADTVNQLTSDGYNVELNLDGARDVPVSECTVTGTHGIPKTAPPGRTGGPGGSSSPCRRRQLPARRLIGRRCTQPRRNCAPG